jgi:hypothetical protein
MTASAIQRLSAPKLLLAALALIVGSPAAAWWDYGHHSVAAIAQLEVRPSTRIAVRRLIAQSWRLETPTCAIRSLEDASSWPDCIKRLGKRFDYSSPWHYQNVDICKPFDVASACPDGNCVSAQIDRNAKLLADRTLPARERVMALAFLAHFVGDLHMPLHVADRGDLGGGRFGADYGVIGGRSLHLIWDGWIAERGISDPPGGAEGILSEIPAGQREAMRDGTIADWSRESWEAGRLFAYGGVMEEPCGAALKKRPVITEEMTRRFIPVVRRQIARGGLRLARLLDEALG